MYFFFLSALLKPLTLSCAVYLLTKLESWQHFRHLGMEEASSVVDVITTSEPLCSLCPGAQGCVAQPWQERVGLGHSGGTNCSVLRSCLWL